MNPPPPISCVTLNLIKSLKSKVFSVIIKNYKLFDTYDLGHVHARNLYKMFLENFLLKLKCKKVILHFMAALLN